MRQITAKFNSACAETGTAIRKGQPCMYDPSAKKVYSMTSKQAQKPSQDQAFVQANEDAYFDNFCQQNNI